jgi:hypothetical protein
VAKKQQKEQVFFVGFVGDTKSQIFGARDAREAVRKWCEFQSRQFWDDNNTAEVETMPIRLTDKETWGNLSPDTRRQDDAEGDGRLEDHSTCRCVYDYALGGSDGFDDITGEAVPGMPSEDEMTLVIMARATDGVVMVADRRETFRAGMGKGHHRDGVTKIREVGRHILSAFPGIGQSAERVIVDHLPELSQRTTAEEAALIVRKHMEDSDPRGSIYFASAVSGIQLVDLCHKDGKWLRPRPVVQEQHIISGIECTVARLLLQFWHRKDDDVMRTAGALIAVHMLTARVTSFVSPAFDCRVRRCDGSPWTDRDKRRAAKYARVLLRRLEPPPAFGVL